LGKRKYTLAWGGGPYQAPSKIILIVQHDGSHGRVTQKPSSIHESAALPVLPHHPELLNVPSAWAGSIEAWGRERSLVCCGGGRLRVVYYVM
jgi:hypothetical protein